MDLEKGQPSVSHWVCALKAFAEKGCRRKPRGHMTIALFCGCLGLFIRSVKSFGRSSTQHYLLSVTCQAFFRAVPLHYKNEGNHNPKGNMTELFSISGPGKHQHIFKLFSRGKNDSFDFYLSLCLRSVIQLWR